jgi:S-DNA-T family DNA segregation ATPase FtsK/SpoIIIE
MASPAFNAAEGGQAASLLNMAMGKDISGRPAIADLARMPHMLVAGATGTGKSVFLNSVLLSFLYRARPDELKLLIVDPKRIEMAVYADLPHLVHPIVVETSLAKSALDWAVAEMERRYGDIARLSVRNMAAYNRKLGDYGANRPPEFADLAPMPYLVVVIDELADLMLTAGKDVETSIVRLAQLARAAGIHLIIATQRPSVDVVTGLIKANFPCRVSFQVTSKVDSRTILDGMGAEQLLGKGDMLFKPAGGQIRRLHGAFVPDEDVGAVADYWRAQLPPSYQVDFTDWENEAGAEEGGPGGGLDEDVSRDPMYAKIADFVMQEDSPSISKIQRYFRIGYNRAARYWDQLKKDGIVGPDNKVRM